MNRGVKLALLLGLIMPVAAMAAEATLETVAAKMITVPKEVCLDSLVEAINQTTVSAQTGGQVKEILFDVDDYVVKDSVIIKLRDTEQKAMLDKAEAVLRESSALVSRVKDEYERIKGVYAKKLVSQTDMDRAEEGLKTAEARYSAAKAGLEQASEQLAYTVVRAPYSGIVTKRHVELGEIASPGQPLMTGISLDRLRTLVSVPQSYITPVRKNGKARVILPEGEPVEAEQITVFPFADHNSNTFMVRVDLPEGVPGLFPGMFVKTTFLVGEKKLLAIPEKALVYRGEVSAVYVLNKEGRVGFRHIRPGVKLEGGQQGVLAGLDEAERVAVDPIAAGVLLKRQAAEQTHGK